MNRYDGLAYRKAKFLRVLLMRWFQNHASESAGWNLRQDTLDIQAPAAHAQYIGIHQEEQWLEMAIPFMSERQLTSTSLYTYSEKHGGPNVPKRIHFRIMRDQMPYVRRGHREMWLDIVLGYMWYISFPDSLRDLREYDPEVFDISAQYMEIHKDS